VRANTKWFAGNYEVKFRMEHAVSNQNRPTITMPASDLRRLERLARAAAQEGDPDALCLMCEINRAETVPDRAAQLDSIVTMGSWVTFWTNWGFPQETRQLVYPEDYRSEETQIPVLSPLGAALIGLKVGSQMPFFAAGHTHIVNVERVSRTEPNVIALLFRAPVQGNDPGPATCK
jgi:regulator of nucleoside diphosphate kinase